MWPLIAIDICNTLADIVGMLESVLGPRPDPFQYHFPGATEEYFKRNLWIFAYAPAIPGAVEGVRFLAGAGDIIYLTARPKIAGKLTREWLSKNGFPAAPIIHSKKKAVVARQMNVSLAVDDAPHEIKTLSLVCPVMVHARTHNEGYSGRFQWNNENLFQAAIDLLTSTERQRKVIG